MTPMVYSALQIITRGRESGVTMVELGQRTVYDGKNCYDQKTCFYLVSKLMDQNLVYGFFPWLKEPNSCLVSVKLSRAGTSTHCVIHKYFYDRSPAWAAIREEEAQAKAKAEQQDASPADETEDDAAALAMAHALDFTPIDTRHLSSFPLVRGRLIRLLKASQNQMHAANNILLALVSFLSESVGILLNVCQGFAHPTKPDRRFFNSRIRELIRQGAIERVEVPSNKRRGKDTSLAPCFRLVDENAGEGGLANQELPEEDSKDDFAETGEDIRVYVYNKTERDQELTE
jgi:oxalate---CoA ligase